MRIMQRRVALVSSAALAFGILAASPAYGQNAGEGVEDIIVTAQKREQRLLDVPIAVSALGAESLQANRITTINDLSGLAPGLTTSTVAGGSRNVQLSMRGNTSNGVVPGADRAVGIYIDGVYIAGSKGVIFDLPEIQRIEVLRGPQGTLFGRNSDSGAISITTRDPKGEFGGKAYATFGNRAQRRYGISLDLPQMGPFSGYISYLHTEKRGDIRNTAAGMRWDRTSSAVSRMANVAVSPEYLGSDNAESFFAALKFESGDFTTVYKFDLLRSDFTPTATAPTGLNAAAPGVGPFLAELVRTQAFAVPFALDGKRPEAVANGYNVPGYQRGEGHTLTSTYRFSDRVSVKNIFAYRTAELFSTNSFDGLSALLLTPTSAPLLGFPSSLVGTPFVAVGSTVQARSKQYSDEIQLNYNSKLLTATVGGIWFNGTDRTNEYLQQVNPSFAIFPGNVVPNNTFGRTFNEITSLAAYAQFEIHATDKLDFILGGRLTGDTKDGDLFYKLASGSPTLLTATTYKSSKFTYSIGVNFKPNNDTLIYAKYSTGFTSGGSTSGITFRPEEVKSYEAGLKAALFDNKVQATFAVYLANYKDVQGATSPVIAGMPQFIAQVTGDPNRASVVGTFVINNGDLDAKGFEFDLTAAPMRGVSFGGSLGYSDSKFKNVNALVLAANEGAYGQIFLPDWTASLWGQYNTPPLGLGDAYASFRFDMRWQSSYPMNANPNRVAIQTFLPVNGSTAPYAILNGRIALEDLKFGGLTGEIAAWGKNLSDNRSASYALILGPVGGANFIPARSYGVDLTVKF
jgi:iron complex outermembrane recepter protein